MDCDLWIFKGFGGVINLLTWRGTHQQKESLDPRLIPGIKNCINKLEDSIARIESHPLTEITTQEGDRCLLDGLISLTEMVWTRAVYLKKGSPEKTFSILKNELKRLKMLLFGLVELESRQKGN